MLVVIQGSKAGWTENPVCERPWNVYYVGKSHILFEQTEKMALEVRLPSTPFQTRVHICFPVLDKVPCLGMGGMSANSMTGREKGS